MFFSEEKAQARPAGTKRLLYPVAFQHTEFGRPDPVSSNERRNKSLLLLFFRKEGLFPFDV
jgi:hypothetical protein